MLTCIVKGTRQEATQAAAERQIPLQPVREVPAGPDHNGPARCWTIVTIPASHAAQVVAWFCETGQPQLIEGFGYPIGSLLLYRLDPDQEA